MFLVLSSEELKQMRILCDSNQLNASSFCSRPVYGFIFLFKWIEERRSRRKIQPLEEMFVEDEETIRDIFFAQQVLSKILNLPRSDC